MPPTGTRTKRDVPDDQVDMIVRGYEMEGATVTKEKQGNGHWTVIATFPDSVEDEGGVSDPADDT